MCPSDRQLCMLVGRRFCLVECTVLPPGCVCGLTISRCGAEAMSQIYIPNLAKLSVRQNGTEVVLLFNDRRICSLPWGHALQVARAITAQARRAEEIEKAEQVSFDHGLMLRTGAPFGLALNARVRQAGEHKAAWDRTLRRALPGGVKSQEKVGVPTVRHAAKEKGDGPTKQDN